MNSILFANNLYNSDNPENILIDAINEFIDSDLLKFPLTESINIYQNLSDYLPLIENVENIKKIKNDISDIKSADIKNKENILSKFTKSLKGLVDWWYKIEPNKKMKTLHVVIKLTTQLLLVVLAITESLGITNVGIGKQLGKKYGKKSPIGFNTKGFDIKMVGKKPIKEISKSLLSKETILCAVISTVITKILTGLSKLNRLAEYNVNKEDMEKNIKAFDEMIDKINNMIEVCDEPKIISELKKSKSSAEQSLAKLIQLKEEFE